jgi:hypothetical protein
MHRILALTAAIWHNHHTGQPTRVVGVRCPDETDRQATEGAHRTGCGAGADARGVLGQGRVSDVVQGLDLPVSTDAFCDPVGGLFREQGW